MSAPSVQDLQQSDMPGLFRAADRAAVQGQRMHVRVTIVQLTMLFIAVLAGVATQITGRPTFGFVGVAAYIVLVAVRVYGRISHHEQVWYENRLLAESIRSLAWRFSVGGAPFSKADPGDPDREYTNRIANILADMKFAPIPDVSQGIELITKPMRTLRDRSLADRRASYGTHRVLAQLNWYADRAKLDAARSARMDGVFLAASAAAVFFGLLQAFDVVSINLLGLFAIMAASAYTWQSQRRYGKQATSYAAAANHLTLVHTRLEVPTDETSWAQFVDDAEDGIGREHTSWRVSRAQG